MRRWLIPMVAAVSVAASAAERPELPLRMLYFCHSAGFVHGSIPTGARVLTEVGRETGLWEVTVSEDPAVITPESLANFDVICAYTTGEIAVSDENRAALLQWVRDGGAYLGVHSATDTWYQWPGYGELIGGYFAGHPWSELVTVHVEDAAHPATRALPEMWQVNDEIYHHRNYSRDRVHVLMALNPDTTDWTRQGIHPDRAADRDIAIAWCRDYGDGRAFYHALGHRDEVWTDPAYQAQLIGAVKWLRKLDYASDPALAALVAAGDVEGLVAQIAALPRPLRDEPIFALGAVGTPAALARLGDIAGGTDAALASAAVIALSKAAAGLDGLLAASHSPLAPVRLRAAASLAGRAEPAAVARLIELIADPSFPVRRAAVASLGGSHAPEAHAALLGILKSTDTWLWRWALDALRPHVTELTDELVAILRAGEPAEAIGGIVAALAPMAGEEPVFGLCLELAAEPGPAQEAAIRVLAGTGKPELGELLVGWLFSENAGIARLAAAMTAQYPDLDLEDLVTPFVPRWAVLGPLPNANGNGAHDTAFAPETEVDLAQTVDGLGGPARWRLVERQGDFVNFRQVWPDNGDNAACYAYCEVRAPAATECELRLGSDDGCKAWLNGVEVINRNVPRGLTIDDDRVKVRLVAGVNKLLVKVMQGAGDWSLTARFANREGGMAGLEFGPEVIAQ